jgi:hypothetical protein
MSAETVERRRETMAIEKRERQLEGRKIEELPGQHVELTPEQAEAAQGGRKAGGDQQEYLVVTMSDVLISQ